MESSEIEQFFTKIKEIEINSIQSQIDTNSKKFLKAFLGFINEANAITIQKHKKIIDVMKDKLVSLCLSYEEVIDEYVVANVVSYQQMKNDFILKEQFDSFVKFLYFVCALTSKLKLTNQIMSNILCVVNRILEYIISKSNDEFIAKFIYLLQIEIELTKCVNSFNPRLMIFIERLLSYISKYTDKKNIINDISKFFNTTSNNDFLNEISSSMIYTLSSLYKNDVNYDVLFSNIYSKVSSYLTSNQKYKSFYENFINEYETNKANAKTKKNLPMNFLIIKPKPLASLDPELDLSFLGNSAEFVNYEEKKKTMERVMKHKIRATEKQAIRKLKKEAKVIDEERQKVIENINRKRKEDLKITNQFIEQQNIEYKKMMTANEKKRFKFKKNKK